MASTPSPTKKDDTSLDDILFSIRESISAEDEDDPLLQEIMSTPTKPAMEIEEPLDPALQGDVSEPLTADQLSALNLDLEVEDDDVLELTALIHSTESLSEDPNLEDLPPEADFDIVAALESKEKILQAALLSEDDSAQTDDDDIDIDAIFAEQGILNRAQASKKPSTDVDDDDDDQYMSREEVLAQLEAQMAQEASQTTPSEPEAPTISESESESESDLDDAIHGDDEPHEASLPNEAADDPAEYTHDAQAEEAEDPPHTVHSPATGAMMPPPSPLAPETLVAMAETPCQESQIGDNASTYPSQKDEPSMPPLDDIITSIKQSITDLKEPSGGAQSSVDALFEDAPAMPPPAPAPAAPTPQSMPTPAMAPAAPTPQSMPTPAMAPAQSMMPPSPSAPPPPPVVETMLSEPSAAQTAQSFGQLMGVLQQLNAPKNEAPSGLAALTVIDLVRELMRPMVKDWLDAHLGEIVQKSVDDEIQRLVRQMNPS